MSGHLVFYLKRHFRFSHSSSYLILPADKYASKFFQRISRSCRLIISEITESFDVICTGCNLYGLHRLYCLVSHLCSSISSLIICFCFMASVPILFSRGARVINAFHNAQPRARAHVSASKGTEDLNISRLSP